MAGIGDLLLFLGVGSVNDDEYVEIGSSPNEIDSVLEIFPILSKMTHEHQEAVLMLRNTKPHLKFPNLYTQMFLLD